MNKKINPRKFFGAITVIYIVLIISANVMASKIISVFGFILDAGVITYPLTFLIGDILAEIYGYKRARGVILWGFAANLAFSLLAFLGTFLPPLDASDALASGYDALFKYNLRILTASFIGYIAGSLLNAASMVRIKKLTGERFLAVRTIGSTALGALADTALFSAIAWAFTMSFNEILIFAVTGYVVKMIYETVIATPLDYLLTPLIKKHVALTDESENENNENADSADSADSVENNVETR
jgi:uncharacterized integral membrane protein (TIGR00697 family)